MTARPTGTDTPDDTARTVAAKREAKGSVHEAIGKLIGDDAARERGTAAKKAAAADTTDITGSRGPGRDDTFDRNRS